MSNASFINEIAPLIQAKAFSLGYKFPSTIIAQAILESNYGKSELSSKYHNYFGMKCGSSWKGNSVNMTTKEEVNCSTITIKDNFRAYSSMSDGVNGYFDFISTSRYANLKNATSYKDYAEKIKSDGYATSSSYVTSLCNLVEKLDLTTYDNATVSTAETTGVATAVDTAVGNSSDNGVEFVVGKEYRLTTNVNARKTANGKQYKVSELSTNGKKACTSTSGLATYKKGTIVTCKDVQVVNGSIWIKTPSCWLCGYSNSAKKFYMEEK